MTVIDYVIHLGIIIIVALYISWKRKQFLEKQQQKRIDPTSPSWFSKHKEELKRYYNVQD